MVPKKESKKATKYGVRYGFDEDEHLSRETFSTIPVAKRSHAYRYAKKHKLHPRVVRKGPWD